MDVHICDLSNWEDDSGRSGLFLISQQKEGGGEGYGEHFIIRGTVGSFIIFCFPQWQKVYSGLRKWLCKTKSLPEKHGNQSSDLQNPLNTQPTYLWSHPWEASWVDGTPGKALSSEISEGPSLYKKWRTV